MKAIVANKMAPDALDHYLATYGYDSQMIDEANPPDAPVNLWNPVPGDAGAHGDFDARASEESPQLWLDTHRGLVALGVLGVGAAIAGAIIAKRAA